MKNKILTIVVGAMAASSLFGQTIWTGNVTTDTTWGNGTNPSPIILDGGVFVTNDATLTVLPGTIVRGQPRTAAVTSGSSIGTPGVLVVSQDGRIIANGDESNPIIFTTAAVDNDGDNVADDLDGDGFLDSYPGLDPNTLAVDATPTFLDDTPTTAPLAPLNGDGEANVTLWGGLIILGSAPTNLDNTAAVGYGKATVEGLTVPGFPAAQATYGGLLPHDNSGILNYVSVRHAGDELGNGNELNGVTLAGVGDGTTFSNVEVYCNFDDGIEWFGGTVNGKNLVVCFAGDDGFDVDQGYTGINQFLLAVMPFFNASNDGGTTFTANFGSKSGNKACEFDGDDNKPDNPPFDRTNIRLDEDLSVTDSTPWPLSSPAFWNMTIIANTPETGADFTPAAATASTEAVIQFRHGFAGFVFNSFVFNSTFAGLIIDADSGEGVAGFDVTDNIANDYVAVASTTFVDTGVFTTDATDTIANGNDLATELGGGSNFINTTSASMVNSDVTFDPKGDATNNKLVSSLKTAAFDPRPVPVGFGGAPTVGGGVIPQGPGLVGSATYRGAFDPAAAKLWTTGWTALNIGGLLAD